MKKTIIALLALAGAASATEYGLLDASIFTLCDASKDVLNTDGIQASNVYGYSLNTWNCTYQQKDLNDQSTVTADGLSLGIGNFAAEGKGNAAAVKIEAEAPVTLSFDVSFVNAWGNDTSAFAATYTCTLYGFSSDGTATELDSWTKDFQRTTVKSYEEDSVTLEFGDNADYASYGVIFSNAKTVGAQGGFGLGFTNIKLDATSLTIPEPATATLSLLALCGLAARRRRK